MVLPSNPGHLSTISLSNIAISANFINPNLLTLIYITIKVF
jgi:hypothetical protein